MTSRGAFLATLAGLCAAPPAASAQELTRLSLTAVPNDDISPILYALQRGLFREAGLDVALQKNSSGAAVAAAVAGGAFDIGLSSMMAEVTGHAHGLPFVLVAPSLLYFTGDPAGAQLTVPKDSPIRSARDLAGKTLATAALKDVVWLAARAFLDMNGVPSDGVKFVEIPQAAVPAALEQRRIDAGTLLSPTLERAMATGRFRSLGRPNDGIAKRWLVAAWFTTAQYADEHRDVLRRFATVVHTATLYANAHHAETAPLIAAYTGIDPAQAATMARVTCAEYLDPREIQPIIDAAVRYGVIDHGFAARELIGPDALRLKTR